MKVEIYVVVTAAGKVKKSKNRHLCTYDSKGGALRAATNPGDTVTVAVVDLERQPLHINGQVVHPEGE